MAKLNEENTELQMRIGKDNVATSQLQEDLRCARVEKDKVSEQCERLKTEVSKRSDEIDRVAKREKEALNRVRELNDQVSNMQGDNE